MIIGDLFSGIGGFSLAAEWMGWETAFFSEIDPFASRVLVKHWPAVPNLGDITRIDWATVEPVDVLCGGFPCQPHSLAGSRKGSDDERDLFSEIIRAARVLRPRYIVLENVSDILTSDDGAFFGNVLGALAATGYDAEWRVLSAAEVGAPHLRKRIWITANTNSARRAERVRETRWQVRHEARRKESERPCADVADPTSRRCRETRQLRHNESSQWIAGGSESLDVPNADGKRLEGQPYVSNRKSPGPPFARETIARADRRQRPDRSWWTTEPDVGRVAHGVPSRVDRLRGLGNSIVPQCAYEIFQGITARFGVT